MNTSSVTYIVQGIEISLFNEYDDNTVRRFSIIWVFWVSIPFQKRNKFTQTVVEVGRQIWPEFNWIIAHNPYAISGDYDTIHFGLGTFWRVYGSAEFRWKYYILTVTSENRYDIIWMKSGTFIRDGDGGYINVCITGTINKCNLTSFKTSN
jgi:hypothetical protein